MYTDGLLHLLIVSQSCLKYWKVHNVHEELNEYAKFMK